MAATVPGLLDLQHMRLLAELQHRRSVTAAAEALSYSPSAVSQRIKGLEQKTGVRLLERVGRGIRLTEAGDLLADHAAAVLALVEEAEADMSRAASVVSGSLRAACFQTAAHALLVPILGSLRRRYPGLDVEVVQADAGRALDWLRSGDVDVVVAEEYDHAPRPRSELVDRVDLGADRMLLAVPADHRLARLPEIALADLAGEHWAAGEANTAFAAMLERACRSIGGFEPQVRHRADDAQLLLALVAHDGAVALVPSLSRPELVDGVTLRPPAETALSRRIFTAVRRGNARQPAVAAVRDALRDRVEELGDLDPVQPIRPGVDP